VSHKEKTVCPGVQDKKSRKFSRPRGGLAVLTKAPKLTQPMSKMFGLDISLAQTLKNHLQLLKVKGKLIPSIEKLYYGYPNDGSGSAIFGLCMDLENFA